MPPRTWPDIFLVAFSFAGEQRDIVLPIAEAVERRLGWGTVFYDEWFPADVTGSARDIKLQKIYSEGSETVVFGVSKDYGSKEWTVAEWDAIRARHMKLRAEPDSGAADRILPLRVAEGDVEGLLDNTIWQDARKHSPTYVADQIVRRLTKFRPFADRPYVFLAETTADLEDESNLVNRPRLRIFLEECGYVVLPDTSLVDLPGNEYRSTLKAQLRKSLSFVQMLSQYPWKGGAFDVLQRTVAKEEGLTMFRFRGDIDLENVSKAKPEHAEFLKLDGAIAGSFDDFRHHIKGKLRGLTEEQEREIRRWQEAERLERTGGTDANADEISPLVRVAICAKNERKVWKETFEVVHGKLKLRLDELAPDKSFIEVQQTDPCDGFIILCDEQSLSDKAYSPREALSQCRQIQWSEKVSALRPPVALIFWPPPSADWPELLRSTPDPLHKVLGDALEGGLRDFVDNVLAVRKAVQ